MALQYFRQCIPNESNETLYTFDAAQIAMG